MSLCLATCISMDSNPFLSYLCIWICLCKGLPFFAVISVCAFLRIWKKKVLKGRKNFDSALAANMGIQLEGVTKYDQKL